MSDAIEEAFINAIRNDPDDDDTRAVYADWLEQRNDLRGEYLRLEAQPRSSSRRAELEQVIAASWLDAIARRYDVVLQECGPKQVPMLKAVAAIRDLGLTDASERVEAARTTPQLLRRFRDREEADQAARELASTGARVAVVPHAGGSAGVCVTVHTVVVVKVLAGKKLAVIKLLRELTGFPTAQLKALLETVSSNTPLELADGISATAAEEIAEQLAGIAEIVVTATVHVPSRS